MYSRTAVRAALQRRKLAVALLMAVLTVASAEVTDWGDSCYSGLAVVRKTWDDCQPRSQQMYPLTAPMDFSEDLPWDCLDEMVISVDSCKLTMASLVNESRLLPGFACSWLSYQGRVIGPDEAHVAAWVRPVPAARYVLRNTNLSSWRAAGTQTVPLADVTAAISRVAAANPDMPVSQLLKTEPMLQLQRAAAMFAAQQQGGGVRLGGPGAPQQPPGAGAGRRLLQQPQPQPQPQQAAPAGGGGLVPDTADLPDVAPGPAPAAAAAAPPQAPPAGEAPAAVAGAGLAGAPGWQQQLAGLYSDAGSPLSGDANTRTITLYNNRRCNTMFQIVSGGALGVGTVDRSTVGKFVMPAVEPFQRPLTFQLDAAALAAAVGDGSSMAAPAPTGMGGGMGRGSNAAFVTLIVMLSVLGAALLGALVWLAVRLARAPKAAAAVAGSAGVAGNGASPFDDGVGRPAGSIAMSPLEQQARAHGPSGGI